MKSKVRIELTQKQLDLLIMTLLEHSKMRLDTAGFYKVDCNENQRLTSKAMDTNKLARLIAKQAKGSKL